MRQDMITVFNQLTQSGLADCNLFKNLLSDHFLKFKYFYSLIKDLDLQYVEKIYCLTKKNSITIEIEPNNTECMNEMIYTINDNKYDNSLSDYFEADVSETNMAIIINIKSIADMEEGELYYGDKLI